jgi:hypothetical protein
MKLGRKELPKDKRRSEKLVVFMTPSEWKALKSNTKMTGEDLRDYVVRVITTPVSA